MGEEEGRERERWMGRWGRGQGGHERDHSH